ncbi:hypothetical protein ACWY4P_17430 [Streptomyces sp. LZ34]
MTVDESPAAQLASQVTNKDPGVGLQAVAALRRLLEELEPADTAPLRQSVVDRLARQAF